jgi:hypothetical protein
LSLSLARLTPAFPGLAVMRKSRSDDRRTFWICRHRQIARNEGPALVAHARDRVARYCLHSTARNEDRDSEAITRRFWQLRRKHHLRGLHTLAPRSVSVFCGICSCSLVRDGASVAPSCWDSFRFPIGSSIWSSTVETCPSCLAISDIFPDSGLVCGSSRPLPCWRSCYWSFLARGATGGRRAVSPLPPREAVVER